MSRFNEAFKIIIGHEGGYQNLYNDRGNWTTGIIGQGERKGTKYGITAMSYPTLDIKNLTLDDARRIYKANYWDKINGDKLEPALALVAFDTAVNSGVGKALEFLNKTDKVVDFLNLRRLYIRALRLYKEIPTGNKSKRTYGQIWEDRINQLEAQAVQWQLIYPKTPAPSSPEPQERPSGTFAVYNRGKGEIIISERYEDDKIIINPIGDKVYVTLK